jgi:azurin
MKLFPAVCVTTAMTLALASAPALAQSSAAPDKPAPAKPATTTTAAAKGAPKGGRTVELTGGDTMKYDKTEIPARPGETLHIVLKSNGTMPKIAMAHNFVLLKAGTDVVEFNKGAFDARETDFIPPSMKSAVIANTPLAGPGETVETTFKVPAKPGSYTFLCSFPGHFALGMRGTLIVK